VPFDLDTATEISEAGIPSSSPAPSGFDLETARPEGFSVYSVACLQVGQTTVMDLFILLSEFEILMME